MPARCLDEDRVALADVDERDAQIVPRRPRHERARERDDRKRDEPGSHRTLYRDESCSRLSRAIAKVTPTLGCRGGRRRMECAEAERNPRSTGGANLPGFAASWPARRSLAARIRGSLAGY